MHDFSGFAVTCNQYWSRHAGITFYEAKLTWESENITDTYFCDNTWIFCYCHHNTWKHLTWGAKYMFCGFAVFCDRYWPKHAGITFSEAKLIWESENIA